MGKKKTRRQIEAMQALGKLLADARGTRAAKAIAGGADIHDTHLGRIEKGAALPDPDVLEKLCRDLSVPLAKAQELWYVAKGGSELKAAFLTDRQKNWLRLLDDAKFQQFFGELTDAAARESGAIARELPKDERDDGG